MRQIININKDWRFCKKPQSTPTALPTDWESVDLPHTWNGTDGQDGGLLQRQVRLRQGTHRR